MCGFPEQITFQFYEIDKISQLRYSEYFSIGNMFDIQFSKETSLL